MSNYHPVKKGITHGSSPNATKSTRKEREVSESRELIEECLHCEMSQEYCNTHCASRNGQQRHKRWHPKGKRK